MSLGICGWKNGFPTNCPKKINLIVWVHHKNVSFLDRIVTCYEKWVLYNNRKRSARWLNKDEAPKHMSKSQINQRKVLLTVWWGVHGIIKYFLLPTNKAITAQTYCQYIQEMHEKLKIQCPVLINCKDTILLHNNTRPHAPRMTVMKLNELDYEILYHPPYSPDLSPTNFHFFKHLDHFISGKTFSNTTNSINEFLDSKNQDFFKNGIYSLVDRWYWCCWKLFWLITFCLSSNTMSLYFLYNKRHFIVSNLIFSFALSYSMIQHVAICVPSS